MGRNRKVKQVANPSSLSDSEGNGTGEVPVEFLTSDDFQVVQKKKNNKRTPDSSEDLPSVSRSRHNSCKFSAYSDAEEAQGSYSSFWVNKSQNSDSGVNCNVSSTDGEDFPSLDHKLIEGIFELGLADSGLKKIDKYDPSPEKGAEKNCLSSDGDKPCEYSTLNGIDQNNCAQTESYSLNSAKSLKKKKKQKLKKLETVSNDNSRSHQSSTSSDNSPMDCPFSNSLDGDRNRENSKSNKDQERKRPSKKQLAAIHEALKKAKEEEEHKRLEEEEKKKQAEEAERLRLEKLRLEQEKKEKRKQKEKLKREKLKAEGKLLSKSQKQARARMQATIEIFRQQGADIPQIGEKVDRGSRVVNSKLAGRRRFNSIQSDRSDIVKPQRIKTLSFSSQESKDSISDIPNSYESKDSIEHLLSVGSLTTESDFGHYSCSEDSDALDDDHPLPSSKSDSETLSLKKFELAKATSEKRQSEKLPESGKNKVKLRSPVVCVLGHVDTGKTKLLDYIRKTHIQDSEAGGITQQIGATMIPRSALKEKCKMVKDFSSLEIEVPGLLVIDTPGHESFGNLRSRGTSLCDIAILVVDIMHGLEAQTLESINLLKANKIPFVVALNKVDRIYGWKTIKDSDIVHAINSQTESAIWDFKKRCQNIVVQFAKECLNAALFYENKDPRSFVSMVPTSAISGDGMGNLLSLITQLTQSLMYKQLHFSNELKATVLEVKVIPGLGTTIDVILVNGQLREGDTIVLCGQDGPIITQIRSLLMPQSLKELRVKNPYIDYKIVEGAQGVKISGKDLDKTLAGMPLFVAHSHTEIECLKSNVTKLLYGLVNSIKTSERGVYVHASTLGSLEALLGYLTSASIPYVGVKIGPVVKKDVMKASTMLEHDSQYAAILAFDVKIERDAQELADHLGVKVLHADIIYHLFDMFTEHRENHLKKLEEKRHLAIFPCILTLVNKASNEDCPFITLEVIVEAGTLKEGTPLCVPKRGHLDIGHVSTIHVGDIPVPSAKEGEKAVVTIEVDPQKPLHLEPDDNLVSRISRQSVEVLKEYYKDELTQTDLHLISELKKLLHSV